MRTTRILALERHLHADPSPGSRAGWSIVNISPRTSKFSFAVLTILVHRCYKTGIMPYFILECNKMEIVPGTVYHLEQSDAVLSLIGHTGTPQRPERSP